MNTGGEKYPTPTVPGIWGWAVRGESIPERSIQEIIVRSMRESKAVKTLLSVQHILTADKENNERCVQES